MRGIRGLFVFTMLVACTPAVETQPSYRDISMPITSVALFDPAQFAGPWDVVAAMGSVPCKIVAVDHGGGSLDLGHTSCGDDTMVVQPARISGPGRYTVLNGAEHWVMWVDQTYRTAVIGTVGGEFGMILNRGRDIPADRMAAAREILDWNGYNLSRLTMRP